MIDPTFRLKQVCNFLPSPAGGRGAGGEGLCAAKKVHCDATALSLTLSRLRARGLVQGLNND